MPDQSIQEKASLAFVFLCVIIVISSLFTCQKIIKGYSESKGVGGQGPHFFYMGYKSGN